MPAPLAPDGGTVAINESVRFTWADVAAQAAYRLQVREAGTSAWTYDTGLVNTGVRAATVAADVLSRGDHEWRVGTIKPDVYPSPSLHPGAATFPSYAAAPGEVVWSQSGFFFGGIRPAAPTLLAPALDETIAQSRYVVDWESPAHPAAQQRFRAQRRSLDQRVTEDSGEVISPATEYQMRLRSTNVTREIRVQVEHDGLWSDWATRTIYVFFVGPPQPEVSVTPDGAIGAIVVAIVNPDPAPQQPTLESVEVYRRVSGEGGDGIRRAKGLSANATFEDYFTAARTPYEYLVAAIGSDGNITETDWIATE